MSRISTVGAGAAVVKLNEGLPATGSGGPSTSVTEAPVIVTVQVALVGSEAFGSSVKVGDEPEDGLSANAWLPPLQESAKALAGAVTASLKVTAMFVPTATLVALLAGLVVETDGALSPLPPGL